MMNKKPPSSFKNSHRDSFPVPKRNPEDQVGSFPLLGLSAHTSPHPKGGLMSPWAFNWSLQVIRYLLMSLLWLYASFSGANFDSFLELSWGFGRCFQCLGVSRSPYCTTSSRRGPSHHTISQASSFLPSLPSRSLFTFIFFLLFFSTWYQLLSFSGSILWSYRVPYVLH